MAYTITLSDGSVIEDLGLSGNNWVSKKKVSEDAFLGKMQEIHITGTGEGGDLDETWQHCELVQIRKYGREWYFVIRERSPEELAAEKIRGDVDYIAMMSDIDLEG